MLTLTPRPASVTCRPAVMQMTMDVLGRPSLLQIHNTADQAICDVRNVSQDLEMLLDFLSRPESDITMRDVTNVLNLWGPNLAALSTKPEPPSQQEENDSCQAMVVAGDAQQQVKDMEGPAAAAGALRALDPTAARRLAKQCSAKAASVLLSQLSKQLNLVEQCFVIVLLHLVQVGVWISLSLLVRLSCG